MRTELQQPNEQLVLLPRELLHGAISGPSRRTGSPGLDQGLEPVLEPEPRDRVGGEDGQRPGGRVAELERDVARDAEAVGEPLACESSDDVIRDSRLLKHRMLSE